MSLVAKPLDLGTGVDTIFRFDAASAGTGSDTLLGQGPFGDVRALTVVVLDAGSLLGPYWGAV